MESNDEPSLPDHLFEHDIPEHTLAQLRRSSTPFEVGVAIESSTTRIQLKWALSEIAKLKKRQKETEQLLEPVTGLKRLKGLALGLVSLASFIYILLKIVEALK